MRGKLCSARNIFLGQSGSIVHCISPLLSIMIDQSEFAGEAQSDHSACNRVVNGEIQLVYISPESLLENRRHRNILLSPAYAEMLAA